MHISRKLLGAALALLILAPAELFAQSSYFEGNADIRQDITDASGHTWIMLADLKFVQREGLVWLAKAGDKTDGASIPWPLWSIVGSPFTGPYVRAALIHDHYCQEDHRVRTWQETHRMFYDGMLAGGVGPAKAKAMYYAVYLKGPKWQTLSLGQPCGTNCVQNATIGRQVFDRGSTDDAEVRGAYDEAVKTIADAQAAGREISAEDIEKLADEKGANPFDRNGNLIR